ncbi:cobalt transporter CbiM [Natroniella sulfidigena]|uniref:cobalt transporter CbiM n=1 Tax=Natroniella sulfidigena TaxID=723921 RepID=UPI00200AD701|nr:cobalt transporter CbiM [Natroniella sulfidigena]
MHISEGVLSAPVLLTGAAATATGTAVALRQLDNEDIPQVAIVSAALFVGNLIHIPLGPTSVHLILNAMAGILLGWKAFPAFLVAFLLQSILFQFGGLTALGVNVAMVSIPAVVCHYLFKIVTKRDEEGIKRLGVAGFICGAVGIALAAIFLMLALSFTDGSLEEMGRAILVANIPLAIIEALLTSLCLVFLQKVKPEVFTEFQDGAQSLQRRGRL